MIRCNKCGSAHFDNTKYCDECGTKLDKTTDNGPVKTDIRSQVSNPSFRSANITSVGIPPLVKSEAEHTGTGRGSVKDPGNARLVIERGDAADTEFILNSDESNIGRWDADNGIFPDVDLDAYDPDAKVSRRHARIIVRNNVYMIEDLGSTNGTFVNRGRRLLPGSPQALNEGDEIIVGKTFLRFHRNG